MKVNRRFVRATGSFALSLIIAFGAIGPSILTTIEAQEDIPASYPTNHEQEENESEDIVETESTIEEVEIIDGIDETENAKEIEEVNSTEIESEEEPELQEEWTINGSFAQTTVPVVIGETYVAPQNDQVTVTFTSINSYPGLLSVEEIVLSEELRAELGASSNIAYDITVEMPNGSFTYDLTLPSNNEINPQVKYSETFETITQAVDVETQEVIDNNNITVPNLDHFTVFFVSDETGDPLDDTTWDCSNITLESVPSDTVECYPDLYTATQAANDITTGLVTIRYGTSNASTQYLSGPSGDFIAAGGNSAFINRPAGETVLECLPGSIIQGDGSGTGILIQSNNVTVTGCTIQGYTFDIIVNQVVNDGSTVQINENTLNSIGSIGGIAFRGAGTLDARNNIWGGEFGPIQSGINGTSLPQGATGVVGSSSQVILQSPNYSLVGSIDFRDTVAPVVAIDSLITRDRTPELSGTVDDIYATVEVTVDGNTYTATNNMDGTWTLADDTISPDIADGIYDVVVTATDIWGGDTATGNVGTDSTTNELTVDRTAPDFAVTNVIDDQVISTLDPFTIEGTASDTLSGILDGQGFATTNGIVVRIFNPGESGATGPALYSEWANYNAMTGNWEISLDNSEIADGTYDFRFSAYDIAGNARQVIITDVVLDSVAPVVEITNPDGLTPLRNTVEVRGSVEDENPMRYYAVVLDEDDNVVAGPGTVYRSDSFIDELLFDWDTTTVPNGTYTIRLAARDLADNRDDNAGSIDEVTVIVENVGYLEGMKFEDIDGNEVYNDSIDSELDEWIINIYQYDEDLDMYNLYDSTDTLFDGSFDFTVPLGEYYVCEEIDNNWYQTYPSVGDVSGDAVAENYDGVCWLVEVDTAEETFDNLDFGNFEYGVISGYKWIDDNMDGIWSNDENAYEGLEIFIDENGNQTLDVTEDFVVTDANGYYEFSELDADTFIVCETQMDGWVQTFPGADTCYEYTVTSGAEFDESDFGNFEYGIIQGFKWNDTNINGIWDVDEPALANWQIIVNGDSNLSTTTDNNGFYSIGMLPFGTHEVCEVIPQGWVQTYPFDLTSDLCHTFTISESGSVVTDSDSENLLNFGNYEDFPVDIGIIVTPGIIGVNETATATAVVENSPTNQPITFVWSGDCSGTSQTTTYTPTAPGSYTCTITATDIDGDSDTGTVLITVDQPIVVITDDNTNTTNPIGQAGDVAGTTTDNNNDETDQDEIVEPSVLGAETCSEDEYGSVSGRVYNDENGNGSYDEGEELSDVRVSVYVLDANNEYQLVSIETTGNDGLWMLENVCPGTYEARLRTGDLPQDLEVNSAVLSAQLDANENQEGIDFIASNPAESEDEDDDFNLLLLLIPLGLGIALLGGGGYYLSQRREQ